MENEELLASDELFRQLVESAPDALIVVAEAGQILLTNHQAQSLFGYSASELAGCVVEALIPPRYRSGHVGHRSRFAAAAKARPMGSGLELFGLRKDGSEFPVEISLSPLELGERRLVSVAIRDISERRRVEAELRQARSEAEAASVAKSEFLSSMSHELRTPMNAILGFAQLLQRDKRNPLSVEQKQKLGYVLQGGEHLLRLIDDILDLSRIEAGRVMISTEAVSVRDVLGEVEQTVAPMASRAGIRFSVSPLPTEAGDVVADRTRLTQVLINFASNAIKYGRSGGFAEIRVEPGAEQQRLRLVVRDDGVGIPFGKQDKIFQPFQRAGQEAGPIEGTGIGLSISKRLAELMGGSVGFRSTPGNGSEFWIELDLHAAPEARVSGVSARAPGARLSDEGGEEFRIVYVEDNPSNIAFMRGVVEELPRVQLIDVPNAEVGIDVIRQQLPRVVIMDINLPGMDGYEAARRLRQWPETADIPVIALTAAAMLDDRKRSEMAGFYRYLTKPVKVAELIDALEQLFSRAL